MISTDLQPIVIVEDLGEPLEDRSSTGRQRPWREKKMANELLAAAYEEVDPRKAERLRDCATFATFRRQPDGSSTLETANFCRVRLCPICTWRRSLKAQAQMIEVDRYFDRIGRKRAYVFVTLTARNVPGDRLSEEITRYMAGWNRLMQLADVKRAVKGWYRALEVTHNLTDDTYHPHLHALWMVNPSYFTSRYYISSAKLVALWRRSMRLDYDPSIRLLTVRKDPRTGYGGAIAEVSKYTTKEDSYIIPDDWDMTIDAVRVLDTALHNRRFLAYGGEIAEARRKLALDDTENGDLIHIDDQDKPSDTDGHRIMYLWYSGYRQYYGKPID